ncbi:glycosyltransferase [Devosia sp. Leaf64]|uniref:glycosyltransferase family 2 protein n=1 Tax=Devosia sp. Leaf64 TaxID=1736229 RepID=UPI000AE9D058|nr:glycosyltransferase [Devosia sp. Leaf64]
MGFRDRVSTVLPTLIASGMGGAVRRLVPLKRRPRVTVVIPCYNYGRYLGPCVASALDGQDGVDVDVIIIDDKSTDDSLATAREIADERNNVRVYAHPYNLGGIATYNDGLTLADGDYVVLLSADDLLTPGSLSRAAMVMEMAPNVGLVYGTSRVFHDQLPLSRPGHGHWIHWPGRDWLRIRCQSGYNVVASPEVMMRTKLLRKIGLYRADLPHAGDFEMWLRAATVTDVGFLIGADQAFYRQHDTNMHKTTFQGGTHQGVLVDLKQRWLAFEAALGTGEHASVLHSQLLTTARATIARHAIQYSSYAYARGSLDFPFPAYEELALRARPDIGKTYGGRGLAWRKRLGMARGLPLHPLWAPSALALRITEVLRRVRRFGAGV